MKPTRWPLAVVVLCLATTGARGGENPAAIAEVAAGKRAEARASWWGFDPKESTKALQAAIGSKARKIIVENMGSPWIVDEMKLRSDLEIVFEPGVIVQAKRGAFQGSSASLFSAAGMKNITLRGPGATLRMWRDDYDDPSKYKKAEWRHVLMFHSCANVQILGLTLAESGGDGIYLGVSGGEPNTNILIQDVVCDRNYRQGISVISARGLTIERCVLKNTAGTAPMAGIDFEPNHPGEEISDCLMRDCLVENNAGGGFAFYLRPLGASSRPVSVKLQRCRSINNRVGFGINSASASGEAVKGEIVVADCEFFDDDQAGLAIGPKPTDGLALRFERCRIVGAAVGQPDRAPIQLRGLPSDLEDVGNVAFDDCVVIDPIDRRPISYHDASGGRRLEGVTGSLEVGHDGKRKTITLDQALIDSWFPFQARRRFPPHPGRAGPFEPVSASASQTEWSCNARQRNKAEWLVWAAAGDDVTLTVRVQPVGAAALAPAPLSWIGPSGKETKLGAVDGTLEVAFRAEETGAHRLVCDPGSQTVAISRSNRRVAMIGPAARFHLLGYSGDLRFYVPANTEAFAARVSGEGPGERVKATLLDPTGAIVDERDDIEGHQFLVERPAAAAPAGEVWTLRLARPSKGVLEDVYVELQGLPPVFATSPEALLKPANP